MSEWKSFPVVVSGSWAKVTMPAEIDLSCTSAMTVALDTAMTGGVLVVAVDMGATTFCDSSGVRIVVLARDWATTENVELRLAVPSGSTLVVLKLVGLDQLLPIYPSLAEALAGEPLLDGDAARG